MMPWDHVILAYIGFSLFVHAVYHTAPTSSETAVLALASLLPDLIDKPLAWQLDLFASGHALGHSVFLATPLSIAVVWLTWQRGQRRRGTAFAIGYWLHLASDVFPQYLLDGELRLYRVLWPVGRDDRIQRSSGFGEQFASNLTEYGSWLLDQLLSGDPDPYLLVVLGIGSVGIALWLYDGMPIGRELSAAVRAGLRR